MKLGVSYYGNRIPWRVKEDLKAIREAGCTYVVHTMSEEDFEFYQGALAEIVEESHRLGLEVWLDPWGVGQAFGGETYSNLIAKDLTLRQMNSRGESLPIACLNQKGFRDYLLQWIDAAAKLKADLLFWDEPHFMIYPEPDSTHEAKLWACCCPACQERFSQSRGTPMPKQMTAEVRAFKEEIIVELTSFLCEATSKKGLRSAVCVLPFENSSTVNDWAKIAAIPSLAVFGTDPYWRPHEANVAGYVGRFAKRIKGLADQHRKEAMLWILNFNIPKGEEGKIRQALEAGYQEGIRNFAAWSYFGASYISIKAEDPAAVWKMLSGCYHELRRRDS